tara:strand:- start:175 stop:843 length:669 start_codon:yes stop_codon:yes gene_type:complete
MKNLTLVIPAKTESDSLPVVLKELKDFECKKIIVIPKNDEDTYEAIKNFDCKIIRQEVAGYGSAIIEGINNVETNYLCIFNADGAFDPKYLKLMLKENENNYDFIFNSRYEKNAGSDDDTFLTYIGNFFFTKLCNLLFNLKISDVLFTYVMGKTSSFKSLKLKNRDFTFCIELPVQAKFNKLRFKTIPSYERARISGIKKVNEFKDGFLILICILKMFISKK